MIFHILDAFVGIMSKYGAFLNAKGKRFCFIIWIIGAIYWIFRYFSVGLYVKSFFCLFSIGIAAFGYINWGKKGIGFKRNKKVNDEPVNASIFPSKPIEYKNITISYVCYKDLEKLYASRIYLKNIEKNLELV